MEMSQPKFTYSLDRTPDTEPATMRATAVDFAAEMAEGSIDPLLSWVLFDLALSALPTKLNSNTELPFTV
jgi:hypothetical protein